MSKKVFVGLISLFILLAVFGFAESQDNTPEEYREDEFSDLLKDLRRGEIIFFGSFPLSLFLTFEVYDFCRWWSHDWQPEYRPWPFRSYESTPYSSREKMGILISALSVSFLAALTDFIIGRIGRAAEEK